MFGYASSVTHLAEQGTRRVKIVQITVMFQSCGKVLSRQHFRVPNPTQLQIHKHKMEGKNQETWKWKAALFPDILSLHQKASFIRVIYNSMLVSIGTFFVLFFKWSVSSSSHLIFHILMSFCGNKVSLWLMKHLFVWIRYERGATVSAA